MSETLRIRRAVRAVIVRPDDALLLVRFHFPDRIVWATPGGGIEGGEDHATALRRELHEEVGLTDYELGPAVWNRTHLWDFGPWNGQTETVYLVRVPQHFEPVPHLTAEQLRMEGVTDLAWWTPDALATTTERFAPTELVALHRRLCAEGPPAQPFDVGY